MGIKHENSNCYECPLKVLKYEGNVINGNEIVLVRTRPFNKYITRTIRLAVSRLLGSEAKLEETLDLESIILCDATTNQYELKQAKACCMSHLQLDIHKKYICLDKSSFNLIAGIVKDPAIGEWYNNVMYIPQPFDDSSYYIFERRLSRILRPQDFELVGEPDKIVVDSVEALETIFGTFKSGSDVAFDIETTGLQIYNKLNRDGFHLPDKIRFIVFTDSLDYGYVTTEELWNKARTKELFSELFSRSDLTFSAHNAPFDISFLREYEVNAVCHFDTMLASSVLWEKTGKNGRHDLKSLSKDYLGVKDWETEYLKGGNPKKKIDYKTIEFEPFSTYAVYDVCATLALKHLFKELMMQSEQYYMPFMYPVMYSQEMFINMSARGIKVDTQYGYELLRMFEEIKIKLITYLRRYVNDDNYNPNSYLQNRFIFYEYLGLEEVRNRDGNLDTGKLVIERYWLENEFISFYKIYKNIKKAIEDLTKMLNSTDVNGRIHPTIKQNGTDTGRISMTNPALQTIPRDKSYLDTLHVENNVFTSSIRGLFVPEKGRVFVVEDYSQNELRFAGAISKDRFLTEMYKLGRDVHDETTLAVKDDNYDFVNYRVSDDDITFNKAERNGSKIINFRLIYGGSVRSVINELSSELANKIMLIESKYKVMLKGFFKWSEDLQLKVKRVGYVETAYGRRKHFPIYRGDYMGDKMIKGKGVNQPIQGGANEFNNLSACELEYNYNLEPVLLVHDSIFIEVDEDRAQETYEIVTMVMEEIPKELFPDFPWIADADRDKETGNPWVDRWAKKADLSTYDYFMNNKTYNLGEFVSWHKK